MKNSKRPMLRLAGWLMLAGAAAMLGCSKKEQTPPAAPTAASAPAKKEPLKIAFAYVGPVGDGGWTFAHDNARKAIEKDFGDKVVSTFAENV
jgi:basic membrane protein A